MRGSQQKILFIINPASGTRNKEQIPSLINRHLSDQIDFEIAYTSKPGEATKISNENKTAFDIIVAVGGDGTINEVARPLIDSTTALGIIPMGSGNGLARHLGIPLKAKNAIKLLNSPEINKIDTIKMEEEVSLNIAGVGFDAHIARLFAKSKKRGFLSYARLVFSEIRKYKVKGYHLEIDGKIQEEKAPFLISIANSTQYGNNAKIAPAAMITDGLMDVCILQKIPWWYYPVFAFHLFNGTIYRSKYYRCLQGKKIKLRLIKSQDDHNMHLDGDALAVGEIIDLSINPKSLLVALPQ
ncbi:MAG: YegS/Rv2252/BmrU family lipid kinase [Fulvivirga sp.]|nr:YegS/Rv2252/BmrU family lipid kinase [Fulvivirga sp.]